MVTHAKQALCLINKKERYKCKLFAKKNLSDIVESPGETIERRFYY